MTTKSPFSIRRDDTLEKAIEALRRCVEPIPTISDVVRQAVMEKYGRDVKPNGKHRNK